jgi:uncharacterized membrane protein YphA (DoxX/SURF4 family)
MQKRFARHICRFLCISLFIVAGWGVFLSLGAQAQWMEGLGNAFSSGLPNASLIDIFRTLMNWLLAVLGFFAVIGFIWAGILFLFSGGSEMRVSRAKSALLYSVVGILVALAGFVIIQALDNFLRGRFL